MPVNKVIKSSAAPVERLHGQTEEGGESASLPRPSPLPELWIRGSSCSRRREAGVAAAWKTSNIKGLRVSQEGGISRRGHERQKWSRVEGREGKAGACCDCPFISWYICMRISSSYPLSIPHPSDIWLTARINTNKPAHHFRNAGHRAELRVEMELKKKKKKVNLFFWRLPVVIAPAPVCLHGWSCKLELCLNSRVQEAASAVGKLIFQRR